MKKFFVLLIFLLATNCATANSNELNTISNYLSPEDQSIMDNYYKKNLPNKILWVHKTPIVTVLGEQFGNEYLKMDSFKNYSKVKVVALSTKNPICKKGSAAMMCRYKTVFMDESGNKNAMPVLVMFDLKTKKFTVYYSGIPNNDIDFAYFLEKNPFIGLEKYKKYFPAVQNSQIMLGMPEKMLIMSWGKPSKINESVGSWGIHKQYVYGDFGPYVYVENGKITSWQD